MLPVSKSVNFNKGLLRNRAEKSFSIFELPWQFIVFFCKNKRILLPENKIQE